MKTRISVARPRNRLIVLAAAALLNGCMAKMTETHYVLAHDPDTDTSNFFKVDFDGRAIFSGAKFSLGEYDRAAVNQIFSESDIQREYLSTKIELVDQDGNRIEDLSAALEASKNSKGEIARTALENLNASLQQMIGRLRYSGTNGAAGPFRLEIVLAQIDAERQKGEAALLSSDPNRLIVASSHLRNALGSLIQINNIVNGRKIVRYFDADGNELDVFNKSILVFVATDTSRFTHAISQVVESENAQQDLFLAISGGRIAHSKLLATRVRDSDRLGRALIARINDRIEQSSSSLDQQKQAILLIAAEAAGKVGDFENAPGIRAFANGLEGER